MASRAGFMQRIAPFPRGVEALSSRENTFVSSLPGLAVFLISRGFRIEEVFFV